jgi:hypothetical protein
MLIAEYDIYRPVVNGATESITISFYQPKSSSGLQDE